MAPMTREQLVRAAAARESAARRLAGGLPPARKMPLWVRALRWLRTQDDRGVGDTAQRIAAKFGGERFKRFSKKVGLPCACAKRQDAWNARWPYQD